MVANNEMTPFSLTVAETIKGRMVKTGITQTELAGAIGRSQSYVALRVIGRASWTLNDIDKIAKHFGMANGFALMDESRGAAH
ncbi:hypothetical protein PG102015_0142 [Bifidobacterium pseudolongum subsp. globosum]|uniref:helix-turn-helix domain-containing protein n=1 Tax=Bifidobacterium pseudolongum TaxID=1694 RepID=UPI0010217FD9|nr:helix-turn-helix transcriptional regulator [Bifidobacterium pseudolongum]RYP97885.1 hypothetical protein PG102015_0142 [Bifidobacterium pseudolongum subsp. globosum]